MLTRFNVPGCQGVGDNNDGTYRLDFDGFSRLATQAEVDAATALQDASEADEALYQAHRADLKTQYTTAVTRLEQIRDAASPTNAQVIAALRDVAAIQLRMLKYIRGL